MQCLYISHTEQSAEELKPEYFRETQMEYKRQLIKKKQPTSLNGVSPDSLSSRDWGGVLKQGKRWRK